MKRVELVISLLFFAAIGFAQSDSHRQKAKIISEIVANIRKSMPAIPVVLGVDLTYSELGFSSGPAGRHVFLRDANAFDTIEFRILRESWTDQTSTNKVSILAVSRFDPLASQRIIDSIIGMTPENKLEKFLFIQTDCPSDGWNKLQFFLQDQAFEDGDSVFTKYLSSKISVPAHIYYWEGGARRSFSDELFVFDLILQQDTLKPKIIKRIKL